jgi:hypothetical protein
MMNNPYCEWRNKAQARPLGPEPAPDSIPPLAPDRDAVVTARLNQFFDNCRPSPDGRGWLARGANWPTIQSILERRFGHERDATWYNRQYGH